MVLTNEVKINYKYQVYVQVIVKIVKKNYCHLLSFRIHNSEHNIKYKYVAMNILIN